MCIAALAKSGGFTKEQLTAFHRANSHGGGYMWVENGVIKTVRHIRDIDSYVNVGLYLTKKGITNLATHCRIATLGSVSFPNAHPFMLNEGKAAMMHNGSFYHSTEKADYSDTRELAELQGDLLGNKELMTVAGIKEKVEDAINGNKVIILYEDNTTMILNESKGKWEGEQWFSNEGWCYVRNYSGRQN
jgi:predicted glutamine amidotransferase